MISRDELARYWADYLSVDEFTDYVPNGLQVEGRSAISRVCSAVTASEEVIEEAIARQADALVVHHGFFWKNEPSVLLGMKKRRLALLLQHDLNLFSYHLPLDCHPVVGNNACFAKQLAVSSRIETHQVGTNKHLLWTGQLSVPMTGSEFADWILQCLNRKPHHIVAHTTKTISRVAWCTGAAQDLITQAASLGVDAYLSGEMSERTYDQARELGVHYYSCGHYASERYGVKALGDELHARFGVEHVFIASENPI